MWRGIALSAALAMLCLPVPGYSKPYPQFDPSELEVRNLLLEAFKSPSPYQQETKLKEVLKIDSENYQALLKLGELEVEREGKGNLKANQYFLRAALAQPARPEAYLALAQSSFQMGYEPEGRDYLRKALSGGNTRLTYEAVCTEGQNYLDTANYYAAVVTYANAALSKASPWKNDPYLLRKLYQAAAMSDAPSFWVWKSTGSPAEGVGNVYWIPYVFAKLFMTGNSFDDDADYQKLLDALREHVEKLREINPKLSPRAAEKWINVILYPRVMAALRQLAGKRETLEAAVQDRFQLSKQFFDFGICDQESYQIVNKNLNLYNVFLEASVKDPQRRKQLLRKLYKIRDQALAAVKGIEDPKKRGKELFKWLRENLIVKYDAVDGIPAEEVIEKKKYLCLTGAILYTLIGRDAGLKVDGFLRPGHAFAVMYDKLGQRINVETTYPVKDTAEQPAGFGLADDRVKPRGVGLRGRAEVEGEISPMDLVSYQFYNVGANKIAQVMLNKYHDELVETLKEQGFDQSKINLFIDAWRHAAIGGGDQYRAIELTSLKYPKFHAEMSKAIAEALDTVEEGRSFNPFNAELLNAIENEAAMYTFLASSRPSSSMLERLRKARENELRALREDVQKEMKDEAESETAAQKDKQKKEDKKQAEDKNRRPGKEVKREKKKPGVAPASSEEEQAEIKTYDKEEKQSGGSIAEKAQGEASAQDTRQEWPREKQFWLSSLRRLEKVVKSHPCSQRLRRILLDHCLLVAKVLTVAKELNVHLDRDNRIDYEDVMDELIRVRTEFFDTQPEMAEKLSTEISQLL